MENISELNVDLFDLHNLDFDAFSLGGASKWAYIVYTLENFIESKIIFGIYLFYLNKNNLQRNAWRDKKKLNVNETKNMKKIGSRCYLFVVNYCYYEMRKKIK